MNNNFSIFADPLCETTRNIPDVLADLNRELLKDEQVKANIEYDFGTTQFSRDWPLLKWIAVYPVRGDSEGYYVHIDATNKTERLDIACAKFWSWTAAVRAAAIASSLLHDQQLPDFCAPPAWSRITRESSEPRKRTR